MPLSNIWHTGALLMVMAVAIVNLTHLAHTVRPPSTTALDPGTRHERRMTAWRGRAQTLGLPRMIAYVGGVPADRVHTDPSALEGYYRTQFALVPFVLDLNLESHTWAVANFTLVTGPVRVPIGWHIVEDFGEGVLLLRKDSR